MLDLRTGVLLIQLGTPDSPDPRALRRFLREFLGDPHVVDLPAPVRTALLEGVILPLRPRRSAAAYRKIWTQEGSPLLVHSRALRAAVERELGRGYVVELGMRYGRPSLRGALARLAAADVARILALPLFPQSAGATTGSVRAALAAELERVPELPPLEVLPAFATESRFIAAWAELARPALADFAPDHVLFSYHGLPQRQVRRADPSGRRCLVDPGCCDALGTANRDCYRAQCFATSRALAAALALAEGTHSTAFQSRLGPSAWIPPYTDKRLEALAAAGHRRLAVLCPAFVADCLETLEEIGIRAHERWRSLGGEDLRLVESLNASPAWSKTVAQWLRERA